MFCYVLNKNTHNVITAYFQEVGGVKNKRMNNSTPNISKKGKIFSHGITLTVTK